MATLLGRSLVPTLLVIGSVLTITEAQTPPAPRPEQAALTDAMAIRDPTAKLEALEKIRTNFPQAVNLSNVDAQILSTLVSNFPERLDVITSAFDRIIARIPPDAAPEMRLSQTLAPVGLVVPKKLLLDRSQQLVTDALAAMSLEKYVQAQRELAKRANRPEPSQAALESAFNAARGRALEQLARIDLAQAEENLKASIKLNPSFGTAQPALADLYMAKGDTADAEAVLKDAIKNSSTPATASRASMALADFYLKRGDTAAAEAIYRETLKTNPAYSPALLALARIEDKRGDSAPALEHYLTAASGGALPAADNAAVHTLYRKAHGNDDGFDEELDKIYRDKFPNPVKPEHYASAAAKNNRVVLLEMFTGSGCGPCVSADLALDAVMERYPANAIVPIAYHANIPLPDPMVVAGGDGRREYYKVRGVPTFNIDGALGQLGGGGRVNTPGTYNSYIAKIDKELAVPAGAVINLAATGDGDLVSITATVSKLESKSKNLRLHLLLVERELHYMGENGVRFHPMVVRATAGDKGAGIPIKGNGTTKYSFTLAAIRDDIANTLKAELEKRHGSEAPGSGRRDYAAEGHAFTRIDPAALSVVAFVQDGEYEPETRPGAPDQALADSGQTTTPTTTNGRTSAPPAKRPVAMSGLPINVLQAAKTDVVAGASAKKGGVEQR